MAELASLNGKVIQKITGLSKYSDEVDIFTTDGGHYRFYHSQSCCENVSLEDYDLSTHSIDGGTVINAYESSNPPNPPECTAESFTWTFYKIETTKGGLWMRWLGTSNGWYSESVNFINLNENDEDEV